MKECIEDKIINPATNRCVSVSGKIGRALIQKSHKSTTRNSQPTNTNRVSSCRALEFNGYVENGDLQNVKRMSKLCTTRDANLIFTNACDVAVQFGHLHILKFFRTRANKNIFLWDEKTTFKAVEYDRLAILKYLHKNGCPWDDSICSKAVEIGNLDIIRYLVDKGAYIDDDLILIAMQYHGFEPNKLIKIITFLLEKECPYEKDELYALAIGLNNLKVLKFIVKKIPPTERTYVDTLLLEHRNLRFENCDQVDKYLIGIRDSLPNRKVMVFLDDTYVVQFDDMLKIEMYKEGVFALPGMVQYGYTDAELRKECRQLKIKHTTSDSRVKLSSKIAKTLLTKYKHEHSQSNAFDTSINDNLPIWKAYMKLKIDYEKCCGSSDESKEYLGKSICHTKLYKQFPGSGLNKACHVQKQINIVKFEKKHNVTYLH